jgi:hypothetical protein
LTGGGGRDCAAHEFKELLLSYSAISAAKYAAYRNTEYKFERGAKLITLRVGEACSELATLYIETGFSSGVFTTAYNPFGKSQSTHENETANARLRTDLSAQTSYIFEGAGIDPSGDWPGEKSFFALGIAVQTAKKLGRKYQQDAIVWTNQSAIPELILLR